LAKALDRRLPGRGVEQSRLERALTDAVRRAGIGAGQVQYPHPGRPDSSELADRAFTDAMLVVEADGRVWHSREAAFSRDRRRDREAARAGWLTVRYTYSDLYGAPEQVACELAAIHARRIRPA
jgi:very-short-patch-repair endonuclease